VNRHLALALGAFTLLSTIASQTTDARPGRGGGGRAGGGVRVTGGGVRVTGGGVRVTGGGGIRFGGGRSSGGVTVQPSPRGGGSWRPRGWSVGGRVVIGGGIYVGRPWYPRYSAPTYVPSYYDGGGYYPVGPAAGPGVAAIAREASQEGVEELSAKRFVGAQGVQLLELIDEQQEAAAIAARAAAQHLAEVAGLLAQRLDQLLLLGHLVGEVGRGRHHRHG
jgi:hypothetical protein